jgi:hypothetical protein
LRLQLYFVGRHRFSIASWISRGRPIPSAHDGLAADFGGFYNWLTEAGRLLFPEDPPVLRDHPPSSRLPDSRSRNLAMGMDRQRGEIASDRCAQFVFEKASV